MATRPSCDEVVQYLADLGIVQTEGVGYLLRRGRGEALQVAEQHLVQGLLSRPALDLPSAV